MELLFVEGWHNDFLILLFHFWIVLIWCGVLNIFLSFYLYFVHEASLFCEFLVFNTFYLPLALLRWLLISEIFAARLSEFSPTNNSS